jgi:putative restriction endonuclease
VNLWVGITDYDWFSLHASRDSVEEVNFWRPSSRQGFRALQPGGMFLFKLRSRKFIGGGGFFAKYLPLPLSLAWDAFGEGNGARTLDELRRLIARNRHEPISPTENPYIGCILLEEPFFFAENDWIPLPEDFKPGIQMGKTYDMNAGTGLRLWNEVAERLPRTRTKILGPATEATQEQARFGSPILVAPRLGQGTFRALVTDAYKYKCAITSEKILPVLQAAHIRPHHKGGENEVRNGLLLRSDLHTLFDHHYLTIEPNNRTLVVSQRLHDDFDNGKYYYELSGTRLAYPDNPLLVPSIENLAYRYDLFKEFEGSA